MTKNSTDKSLRIMQVAVLIQKRYQKARDLMLSGTFGEPFEDEDGKLVVLESEVRAWKALQAAPVPNEPAKRPARR
jgi:hypothetical protein